MRVCAKIFNWRTLRSGWYHYEPLVHKSNYREFGTMSNFNEMTSKDGISFQCKKQQNGAGRNGGVHIDITSPQHATNVQFDIDDFFDFADFVEDTRAKLLQDLSSDGQD
jgi:hypothetical protein